MNEVIQLNHDMSITASPSQLNILSTDDRGFQRGHIFALTDDQRFKLAYALAPEVFYLADAARQYVGERSELHFGHLIQMVLDYRAAAYGPLPERATTSPETEAI